MQKSIILIFIFNSLSFLIIRHRLYTHSINSEYNMSRQGEFARVSIKFGYRKTLRQSVSWSRHSAGAPTRSLKRRTYLSFAESVVAFASLCQAGALRVSSPWHTTVTRNIELTYSNMLDRRTLWHTFSFCKIVLSMLNNAIRVPEAIVKQINRSNMQNLHHYSFARITMIKIIILFLHDKSNV